MSKAHSVGTGRFLRCPGNQFVEGHRAIVEVRQGPRVCFQHCPLCGSHLTLCEASGWRAGSMSLEEAEKLRDDPSNVYPVFIIRAPSPETPNNERPQRQ